MAETSLAIRTGGQLISSYDEAERAAKAMAASGFFADSRNAAQAVVKILAGQEMGFGPFASMNGVYIISGRPSIGANLMAAAVKKSGRYNYQIAEMTEKACSITFFENGKEIGVSTFTAEDARKAGTKNMDKYARNMLFARAMSNGVRWYCPDVFNGSTVYTPEELGANVNEDGEVIDLPVTETTPAPTNGKAQPAPAQQLAEIGFPPEEPPAQPETPPAAITLETAMALTTSAGDSYGDLTSDELADKSAGIAVALRRKDLSDERRADLKLRVDAIGLILKTRAAHTPA